MERGLIKTSVGYVHYRSSGQGKPIVLLHSCPKSSTQFLELTPILNRHLHVVAVDYPSYGMSDPIPGNPKVEDYAKIIMEVMDGLKVDKFAVLGEATGAYIAVELANAYPGRVDRIILLSCPFWPTREFNEQRHIAFKALYRTDSTGFPLPRTLEEILEKDPEHIPMNPTQEWMDRDNVALMEAGRNMFQCLDAIDEYDFAPNLERLQVPVLLIWGEHFYYLQFRDEVTRRIKNHRVVVIKGGRFILPADHAEEVGAATLEFLGFHA
jgi:pimeloyl-ACP methyl ester carboxylesterase